MYVLIIEQCGENQVVGPGTLDGMQAAAREHAAHKHQAEIIQIEAAPNAVETWWIEGSDQSYSIHKLAGRTTERIYLRSTADAPEIEINAEQAEQWSGSGGGPQVAEIDVISGDQYSRFFISIGINRRSQAVCEVATNTRDLKSTRKTVTATRKRPLTEHHVHGE